MTFFWLHLTRKYITELWALLTFLSAHGHKANVAKAQLAATSVQFLGQSVTAGQRSILPDRAAAVRNLAKPSTVKGLWSFLGTCN